MNQTACALPGETPCDDWPLVKPMHGRTTGPLLSFVLFLVLGGIEASLGVEIADRWQAGKSILPLATLAFPLSLVWLVTMMTFLQRVLVLFLPRMEFRSPRFAGRPGDRLYFSWMFGKRPSQIRELVVSLEGYEERRRGHGRNDCWRKTVLFFKTVFTTTDATDMAAGELPVVIPYDAKPTRLERTHRIRWVVRVHGRVSCLPDLVDGYELIVLPVPTAVPDTVNAPN